MFRTAGFAVAMLACGGAGIALADESGSDQDRARAEASIAAYSLNPGGGVSNGTPIIGDDHGDGLTLTYGGQPRGDFSNGGVPHSVERGGETQIEYRQAPPLAAPMPVGRAR